MIRATNGLASLPCSQSVPVRANVFSVASGTTGHASGNTASNSRMLTVRLDAFRSRVCLVYRGSSAPDWVCFVLDGKFWMSFPDFLNFFRNLYVCLLKVHPDISAVGEQSRHYLNGTLLFRHPAVWSDSSALQDLVYPAQNCRAFDMFQSIPPVQE